MCIQSILHWIESFLIGTVEGVQGKKARAQKVHWGSFAVVSEKANHQRRKNEFSDVRLQGFLSLLNCSSFWRKRTALLLSKKPF